MYFSKRKNKEKQEKRKALSLNPIEKSGLLIESVLIETKSFNPFM